MGMGSVIWLVGQAKAGAGRRNFNGKWMARLDMEPLWDRLDQYHQRELCRDERGAGAGDVAHAGDGRGDAGVRVGDAPASEELSMRRGEMFRALPLPQVLGSLPATFVAP